MSLMDNEKWEAVIHCDEGYDGKFFYGVKTTGIFCKPSCKSKTPLRKNVEFFDEKAQAYAKGLRPCKRCRPDLLEYQPMIELLEKAQHIYNTCFEDRDKLILQINDLNVSQNHLIRLFRQQVNMTPLEYVNKLRVEKAMHLLSHTDTNILNIALMCGFGSVSTFYEAFKKQMRLTPNEYRKSE